MELNEHILLVMRWLQNNGSVSLEELRVNYNTAKTADVAWAKVTTETAYAAYNASYVTTNFTVYASATTKTAADTNVKYWSVQVKNCLNEYFQITNEDRKAYERQVRHLNILGINNG